MGANAILDAFPEARFYASLQTVEAINNEAWRTKDWIKMFGPEKIPAEPKVPEVFNHTFFTLEGDEMSPIHLLSPLQGDTVDHTMFWLPTEGVIVAGCTLQGVYLMLGDTVYGRTFPLYLEEAATPALAAAWENSLLRCLILYKV
jgi:glyoxylase-like metal-dependent hydrolase (beta-lactamase superfamily II)